MFFVEPKEIQDARIKVDETVKPRPLTEKELLRQELDEMKEQLAAALKAAKGKGKTIKPKKKKAVEPETPESAEPETPENNS